MKLQLQHLLPPAAAPLVDRLESALAVGEIGAKEPTSVEMAVNTRRKAAPCLSSGQEAAPTHTKHGLPPRVLQSDAVWFWGLSPLLAIISSSSVGGWHSHVLAPEVQHPLVVGAGTFSASRTAASDRHLIHGGGVGPMSGPPRRHGTARAVLPHCHCCAPSSCRRRVRTTAKPAGCTLAAAAQRKRKRLI